MSWRYITNKNLKQTEGSTVKEINGNKQYTVAKVGRNMISIVNDFGFAQFISRQVFKDSYVVQELDVEINKLQNTIQQIENNYNNITIQIKQLEQKKKKVAQIKINNKYSKDDIIEAIQDIYVDCNKLEIHININGVLFQDSLYI